MTATNTPTRRYTAFSATGAATGQPGGSKCAGGALAAAEKGAGAEGDRAAGVLAEYGKRCQSCHKRTEARRYHRPSLGVSGKHRTEMRWRRLCRNCWEMANENTL